MSETAAQPCRRCGRPVEVEADRYDIFEQMHYVCFHYEFEHDPADPDEECSAGGCPSRAVRPRPDRRPAAVSPEKELLTPDQAWLAAAHFVRQYFDRGRSRAVLLMLQGMDTDPATPQDWRRSVSLALVDADPFFPELEPPLQP